ncbi:MAG TPA: SDR family oxidoreductase [Steroidobacteraceae bacterium]|nr:SDR family oxidoreductase [Steroidobacteraceae bacterium]
MSVVLITGANRGIGLALTKLYAQRGDMVLACCRTPNKAEQLQALAKSYSVKVLPLSVDDDQSVTALSQQLSDSTIDVLINNAGINGGPRDKQTATTMDFSAWANAFNVNTMGPVRVMQSLLPQLKRSKSPKVMNVTSQLGALSLDANFSFAYCSTKAALNKFMRMAAIELKQQGIAIGLVHPGWVQTDMGGAGAAITPTASADGIAKVIDQLTLDNAGSFWKWDGGVHAW